MKRHAPIILLLVLAGCASTPATIPAGLGAAEMFQRAQEAVDKSDFALGIRYYSLVKASFPDDVIHTVWASYEVAFLNHKMGKDAEALTLVTAMLDSYSGTWDTLPADTAAPRILAENLKTKLEALTTKKQ